VVVEAPTVAIGCARLFLSATAFFLSAYKYYPHRFSCMWGSIRTLSPVVFTHWHAPNVFGTVDMEKVSR